MIKPKVGFIVFGVHKDGLQDPAGNPFIDAKLVRKAVQALTSAGLKVVEHEVVIATKAEAREGLGRFKRRDDVDAVVLFSGTWVWSAHLVGALRDFAASQKGIVLWTNPGSQGWRPVGGLVMHGALKEIGLLHRFVYGHLEDAATLVQITAYCKASAMKGRLNLTTIGAIGGRGMGQSCGVADPSQWMKTFGVDIDSRDTTELLTLCRKISRAEVARVRREIQPLFAERIPTGETADRSIRLYIALRELVRRHSWEFYTIQSFPGLASDYSATCLAQSLMLEHRISTSTLGDFNTAMTVKLLTDLSDQPVYYGDLQHIDPANNEIKIIGDGACPPSLAGRLGPAGFAVHGIPTEGEAGGISVKLICQVGEGVLARLGRHDGKFEMVIVRCSIFEPPAAEVERRLDECGIPFWPHGFVTAHCELPALLEAWNNEYACLGYGKHLYEDLVAFCELTGIKAIAL